MRRAAQVVAVCSFAGQVGTTARGLWRRGKNRVAWRVTIEGDDPIWPDVHAWLLEQLPANQRRSLTAKTRKAGDVNSSGLVSPEADHDGSARGQLDLFFAAQGEVFVRIDGHLLSAQIERNELLAKDAEDLDRLPAFLARLTRLTFTAFSTGGRDAVHAHLARITEAHYAEIRTPRFYLCSRWGDFRRRDDLPARPLDTVILRRGQKERLIEDLQRFYDEEGTYVKLGMPWHRSYLLHGPPGTGKTSIAKALAHHFNLDLHVIPLADLENDGNILNAVASIERRSLLLLEDIDILHASTSREEGDRALSMSGLLNALDGVSTPHGLVTVMTTNDLAALDPALTRPGRGDVIEAVDYIDTDQLGDLFDWFYSWRPGLDVIEGAQLTAAEVMEVFKRHSDDVDAAAVVLAERCQAAVNA